MESQGKEIDLKEAAELFRPKLQKLCQGELPEDWNGYVFSYLQAVFFPESFTAEKMEERSEAVSFYINALNELFDHERSHLAFDPLRDFALLQEKEEAYTQILPEYERFLKCFREDGVYVFMRLSRECTPYQTLGHIAGVHHVAMYMARQLVHTEIPIDLGLMSGAALMHDIGKFGCRPEEGRRVPYLHYYYTYQYCQKKELHMIGDIASNHSVWDLELDNLSVESLLLIYADFRVKSIYDQQKNEQIQFWDLDDSYQVILDKLDNVDEAKRRRYERVYARLKDFEDYLIRLGLNTDLESAFGVPEKENFTEIMTEEELIRKLKGLAIHSNLLIMERITREDRFIELLEDIRSYRDSRQIRSYLTAIAEYSDYIPQSQKKIILKFLQNMLAHRDGDIRRQSAEIAGIMMANYEICFTKEIPEGYRMPSLGETRRDCFREFLHCVLNPGAATSERERRHAGYAMKTVMHTLLQRTKEEEHQELIGCFLEQCRIPRDETGGFILLDIAAQIQIKDCSKEQQRQLECFVLPYLSGHSREHLVAALTFLLLWLRQGWQCSRNLVELIENEVQDMKTEAYCIQYLHGRIREFYGFTSDTGILYYDVNHLYLENQRAELPWIFKYTNLLILKERQNCNQNKEQLYQYASHLLNLLQFSERIVIRLQAGSNLLEIFPGLPETQKYEIVLELVKALEIGEYAVSKYIPPFLGKIYHLLGENEQLSVMEQLEGLMEHQENHTILTALETAGAVLKNAPAAMKKTALERFIGILCCGMASDQFSVTQEAFYIAGHMLFSDAISPVQQKAEYFTLLLRKMLSFADRERPGVYVYYNGAAFNQLYRFAEEYRMAYGSYPLKEAKKMTAFFPGTFDPFSLGHKEIVKEIVKMGFRVYLAVDEFSWSKRTQPFQVRRRILAMSTADLPDVYLFPEELPVNIANPRDLLTLRQSFRGEIPWIVAGSDVIFHASAYKKTPEKYSIHNLPHLVFDRNTGGDRESLKQYLHAGYRFVQLPSFFEEVSSTMIRENMNEGRDISGLVAPGAYHYIYRRGLYAENSVYKKTARYRAIETSMEQEAESFCLTLHYEDGEKAGILFRTIDPRKLMSLCRNMEQADLLRGSIYGTTVWIDRIYGSFSERDDLRLTALNEALEYFQEQNWSFALCRPEEEQREILTLHGFEPLGPGEDLYLVNLNAPLVLFYDTRAFFKDEIADAELVKQAIRVSHIRLLKAIRSIYRGRLILCFESEFLNYRLLKRITEENHVSMLQTTQRVNGEKMCVPFGKILKGVRVPNTVTKELETEKQYSRNRDTFAITHYRGFASLPIQMRTVHSFDRPVIFVDDLYHTGYRMRELKKHMVSEGVDQYQMIVGVLSGRGEDLAEDAGHRIQSIYSVPNLNAWLIESDLYPFLGGDGVEASDLYKDHPELCPSINPILPYALPDFLEGASLEEMGEFSRICIENARDIFRAVEKEYSRIYGRRLTLEHLQELTVQPRCPETFRIDENTCRLAPSKILEEEVMRLDRLYPKYRRKK